MSEAARKMSEGDQAMRVRLKALQERMRNGEREREPDGGR